MPVAASLSMSDFHVPEFAHFGKRVVLKVMKQLKEHSRTRYRWTCWVSLNQGQVHGSKLTNDFNFSYSCSFSLWPVATFLEPWSMQSFTENSNIYEYIEHVFNNFFQCEHQMSYSDGNLESVKWYKVCDFELSLFYVLCKNPFRSSMGVANGLISTPSCQRGQRERESKPDTGLRVSMFWWEHHDSFDKT